MRCPGCRREEVELRVSQMTRTTDGDYPDVLLEECQECGTPLRVTFFDPSLSEPVFEMTEKSRKLIEG
jgi:hypothetical protein